MAGLAGLGERRNRVLVPRFSCRPRNQISCYVRELLFVVLQEEEEEVEEQAIPEAEERLGDLGEGKD